MTRSNLFQRTRKLGRRIPQWLRRVLLILTLLWLVLSLWQAPVVRQVKPDTQELRGVWMTNFGAALMYYTTGFVEVVQRYGVDDIQLYDHFGLPIEFGYDSYTTKLYQKDHSGATPPLTQQIQNG